jgi:hypothetical protein
MWAVAALVPDTALGRILRGTVLNLVHELEQKGASLRVLEPEFVTSRGRRVSRRSTLPAPSKWFLPRRTGSPIRARPMARSR